MRIDSWMPPLRSRPVLVLSPVLLVGALVGAACRGREPPGAEVMRPAQPSAAHPTPPPAPTPAPASDPFEARREQAMALVGRWLEAQNRGDFTAYEALYAEPFTGIKRTARQTKQLDRRRWLEDRRRMFARPMTVSASGIAVVPAEDDAIVSFTQRYASGRYADEGTKRMRVVFDPSGPRIRTEELLAPKRLSATEVELDAGVMLVTRLTDGKPYVVLGYAPPDMRGGPLHLLGAPSTRLDAARDVAPENAGIAAPLLHETLTVFTGDTSCSATLGALRLVRGAEVMEPTDFEPDTDLSGDDDFERGLDEPHPDPEIVWEIGAHGGLYGPEPPHPPWLVAELRGACAPDGVLAIRSGVAPPTVLRVEEPSIPDGLPYVEAFAHTLDGSALDEDDAGNRGQLAAVYRGLSPSAHEPDESSLIGVELLHIGDGPERASFLYTVSDHPCGGDVTATLLLGQPPSVRPVDSMTYGTPTVLAAFDLESDGTPEVVARTDPSTLSLIRLGRRPAILRSFHFSYQVCGC